MYFPTRQCMQVSPSLVAIIVRHGCASRINRITSHNHCVSDGISHGRMPPYDTGPEFGWGRPSVSGTFAFAAICGSLRSRGEMFNAELRQNERETPDDIKR